MKRVTRERVVVDRRSSRKRELSSASHNDLSHQPAAPKRLIGRTTRMKWVTRERVTVDRAGTKMSSACGPMNLRISQQAGDPEVTRW